MFPLFHVPTGLPTADFSQGLLMEHACEAFLEQAVQHVLPRGRVPQQHPLELLRVSYTHVRVWTFPELVS